jgi:hypothetical protein
MSLRYGSSKLCTCPLNKFIQALKYVKFFLKQPLYTQVSYLCTFPSNFKSRLFILLYIIYIHNEYILLHYIFPLRSLANFSLELISFVAN